MSSTFALSQRDAVEWLRSLPEASADLALTDPPYESLEKHRAVGTTTRLKHSKASSNDWFAVFANERFAELFDALYRVLKRDAHFYLFSDAETMFVAKPIAEARGFRFWKPLIWDKKSIGMGYHYRARYECILFFEKGKRRLADLGVPDIIEAPRIRNGYPAEKPVAVGDVLVRQSSALGDLVIDPFMGSAAFGVAAIQAGRHFTGTDTSRRAVDLARARLTDAGGTEAFRLIGNWVGADAVDTIRARGVAGCTEEGRRVSRSDRGVRRRELLTEGPCRLHRGAARQDDHRQEPQDRRVRVAQS
jgi:site-specific DNA-methyltransferase (adenine-specific)